MNTLMRYLISITLLLFIVLSPISGQLSPGDLTDAHAHLEGLRNCTACHVLGDKVTNAKCLSCHKELKQRVDQNKGFHVSKDVKGKECASCHSEHHGRKFKMIRFEEETFDHKLTGYELTGAHKKIDCRQCHKPDFIDNKELKLKKNTYLGLGTSCVSCHTDYHQKTLPKDCAECHTTEAFIPASKFDHNKSNFKLVGKHETVACIDCHQKEVRNGKEFQRFKGVAFTNCSSCHADPHRNEMLSDCKSCHTEQTFKQLNGKGRFDHRKTGFPLKGKHNSLDCTQCHTLETSLQNLFKDRKGVPVSDCIQCHNDVHEGRFGINCKDCHTEDAFQSNTIPENFNHELTQFPLKGKHLAVDCRDCHTESLITPLPHNACAACHTDYHNKEFEVNGQTPDCAQCHTEDGFEGSLFTLEDHNKTSFPLEGAHMATPCFACHLKEDRWTFRNIGIRCIDCHDDVHDGHIPEQYYPGNACDNCHRPDGWRMIHFDHNSTDFPLTGKHATTECRACHKPDSIFKYGQFRDLTSTCISCHEDVHYQQFAVEGQTNCARCHLFDNWKITTFNHDNTAFKLEGKHATLACDACHKEELWGNKVVVRYKIEKFECIDCHKF